jgi:hypothetical protein
VEQDSNPYFLALPHFKFVMEYKPGKKFRHLKVENLMEIWLPLSASSLLAVNNVP